MLLTRQGNLTPVCASRALSFNSASAGKVWGFYWGWGIDGKVFFIQQDGAASTWKLKTFDPDPTAVPLPITEIGSITGPITVEPDWTALATTLYVTIFGDKTYAVTPSTGSLTALTGSYGAAAAGRAICLFGERLFVGGVNDARFGNQPNRLHFSGDDTNNDPTVRTAWESLNYVDIGVDGTPIAGLYPLRDFLVVVLADQQVWTVTGVPNATLTTRRIYGFHKGKGGSQRFTASHAVADPSQTRIWMYDHGYRGPVRFNGASLSRIPQFGTPTAGRLADATGNGAVTPLGGPDEFLMHGVAVSRAAGEDVSDAALELIRYNGIHSLVQRDVIVSR